MIPLRFTPDCQIAATNPILPSQFLDAVQKQ
jgi:hypothetical protein